VINIIIPMAGLSPLAKELEYPYPSPLVEIQGIPLIQYVIENLCEIGKNVTFSIILRDEDCRRFHLDSTVKLLTSNKVNVVRLQHDTAGALCSILMAIEHFDNDHELIIANSDQIFDKGVLSSLMKTIGISGANAACPIFDSVHPRWSYLRISGAEVVEAVEKNPVSRHAVAGLYYFRSGKQFANLAKRVILNGRETDGKYFTSAVLNEYILDGLPVLPIGIHNETYSSLFTAQRVHDFERRLREI
jgi:dTDP-glucose pyrophosphorylase